MDLGRSADYPCGMDKELPSDMQVDAQVDALGLLCPLPVLRARKRLISMEKGQVLLLLTDDPAAVIDVPHFCNEQGFVLLGQSEQAGTLHFFIRK